MYDALTQVCRQAGSPCHWQCRKPRQVWGERLAHSAAACMPSSVRMRTSRHATRHECRALTAEGLKGIFAKSGTAALHKRFVGGLQLLRDIAAWCTATAAGGSHRQALQLLLRRCTAAGTTAALAGRLRRSKGRKLRNARQHLCCCCCACSTSSARTGLARAAHRHPSRMGLARCTRRAWQCREGVSIVTGHTRSDISDILMADAAHPGCQAASAVAVPHHLVF